MTALCRSVLLLALACSLSACMPFDSSSRPKPLFELSSERDRIRSLQIARVIPEPSSRSVLKRAPAPAADGEEWLHVEVLEALSALPVKTVQARPSQLGYGFELLIELDDSERERLRRYSSSAIGERSAMLVDGEVLIVSAVRGPMHEASFVISGVDGGADALVAMARRFQIDD